MPLSKRIVTILWKPCTVKDAGKLNGFPPLFMLCLPAALPATIQVLFAIVSCDAFGTANVLCHMKESP